MIMRQMPLTLLATLLLTGSSFAGNHKIYFRGTESLALQSAAQPAATIPAGYLGTPSAGVVVPTQACVPGAAAGVNSGTGVPNQVVTFLHPYTNKAITIPLTLPVGKPTIVTRQDRIIYNYGLFSQKVIVKFLPDGMVEVNYRG